MNSPFLNIDLKDFAKGLILAVLSSVLTIVYTTVQTGSLSIDWKLCLTTSLTSGIAYVIKNLFTNSKGQTFKSEA